MYLRKLMRTMRIMTLYILVAVMLSGTPAAVYAAEPTSGAKTDPPKTYTYDPITKRWNSNTWIYNKETDSYIPAPVTSPASAPVPVATATNSPTDSGGAAITDKTTQASSDTTVNNDIKVDNNLLSDAKSGDSSVASNTNAGDAKTGDASATTTIVNSVHSTVGGDTSGIAQFTVDLNGDVVGDITIGPDIKNAVVNNRTDLSANTDVDNNIGLTNNVTLGAASGNASVVKNTQAGSAATGNANSVANILNLINTIIAANKSFVGTINIYGNLNGDILISPEFIPQLIASNATITDTLNLSDTTVINDDNSIVNNVKLDAATGNATVSGNTTAGTAKTGTASTNLTVLNLTGHEVDASNSLLVFVNVLGKWVGMIVDAPNATAAALGSGVINNKTNLSTTANLNNDTSITNNIDLSALTGNASVTNNTLAGSATSGDATASANIANISTSVFHLSDWFGVLFINVYGQWIGSFGIDTKAGTVKPLAIHNTKHGGKYNVAQNIHFGFNPSGIAVKYDRDVMNHEIMNAKYYDGAGGTYAPSSSVKDFKLNTPEEWSPLALAALVAGGTYASWLGARFWLDRRASAV